MDIDPGTSPKPQRWQPPAWPRFYHPGPATVLAIGLVVLSIGFFITLLIQLFHQRHARRKGFVLVTGANADPEDQHHHHHHRVSSSKLRPTSFAEIETRQLLFPDRAGDAERLPLYNPRAKRGSLYNTFQIPPPHNHRLKPSRSMMELNGGNPLGPGSEDDDQKSKTVHWHGVNRLNTAWGWMS